MWNGMFVYTKELKQLNLPIQFSNPRPKHKNNI